MQGIYNVGQGNSGVSNTGAGVSLLLESAAWPCCRCVVPSPYPCAPEADPDTPPSPSSSLQNNGVNNQGQGNSGVNTSGQGNGGVNASGQGNSGVNTAGQGQSG